jgi:hypothetical protein
MFSVVLLNLKDLGDRTPFKRGNDQEEEVTALRATYLVPAVLVTSFYIQDPLSSTNTCISLPALMESGITHFLVILQRSVPVFYQPQLIFCGNSIVLLHVALAISNRFQN